MTFHYIDLMKSFALHNVLKKVRNRAYNSDKKRVSMKHKIYFVIFFKIVQPLHSKAISNFFSHYLCIFVALSLHY